MCIVAVVILLNIDLYIYIYIYIDIFSILDDFKSTLPND